MINHQFKMKIVNCKIESPVESPQKLSLRAERSNLAFCKCLISWDCFVATLLAMTIGWTSYGFINVRPWGRSYG